MTTMALNAILPEKVQPLLPFLEQEAKKNKVSVDQLLDSLAAELKGSPIPAEELAQIVDYGSRLRIAVQDQHLVADAMTRNGIDKVELVQAAVAVVGLEAFLAPILKGKGLASNIVQSLLMQDVRLNW